MSSVAWETLAERDQELYEANKKIKDLELQIKKLNITKQDYKNISAALFMSYAKPTTIRLLKLINKPVEATKEQPKTYCKAKAKANNPGLPECDCHNFCKFDDIQFDTSLG